MVSPSRSFLGAILLTAAAGFAYAQQATVPPPSAVPDAAVPAPAVELPQLPVVGVPPVADANAPAVDPAVTIDPSVFAVAPAAAPKSAAKTVAMPAFEFVPSGTVVTSQLEGLIPDIAGAGARNDARTTMLIREWMLAGVLIVGLFGVITLLRRRQIERGPIVDFIPVAPKLKPATARTYGPRPA